MTAHINYRTATETREPTVPGTTGTAPSGASPKRPVRRWITPIVAAAAVGFAGIAVLVNDGINEPAPSTDVDGALGNGRVLQPGLPDGYWEPANPDPSAEPDRATQAGNGQRFQPGLPDGYWEPTTAITFTPAGNSTRLQPGLPDGYWVPTPTDTPSMTTGQRSQPGLPDGYWVPTPADAYADRSSEVAKDFAQQPEMRPGQLLEPGQPDGGVAQPVTSDSMDRPAGTGRMLRPGLPDGSWDPNRTESAPVASAGCKISGPC